MFFFSRAIDKQQKRLIWIGGEDDEFLAEKTKEHPEIIVNEQDWQMDRLIVAADLAITKGTRKTLKELAVLGVPSISLSRGLNEIDDVVAPKIPTNLALRADSIDGPGLARAHRRNLGKRVSGFGGSADGA